jgi:lipopolysaccharide export system protein LptA
LYNTNSEIATFISETYIEDSAKRTILTSEGYYDLKNKNASFSKRPVIHDGPMLIIANQVTTDDYTGLSVLTGNAIFRDTSQGLMVTGNSIISNRNTGSMRATQKPVMIIVEDKDSTFVAADTLYSGKIE